MSAIDLFEQLHSVRPGCLTPLQRILLITDGTLTEILEAHFLERIELIKLSERLLPAGDTGTPFPAAPGEPVLERKINLRGSRSGVRYVYAHSHVFVGRLAEQFQSELMESDVPLGRLWRHHRLETFKQLVSIDCRPAACICAHLECGPDAEILARSYDVYSSGRPVMRISEYFPRGD